MDTVIVFSTPNSPCLMTPSIAIKPSPQLFIRLTPAAFRLFATTSAAAPPTTSTLDHGTVTTVSEASTPRSRSNGSSTCGSARDKRTSLDADQFRRNWLESLSCPWPNIDKNLGSEDSDSYNADSGWAIGVDPDLSGAFAVLKPDNSPQVYDSPHLKVLVGKRVRKRLDVKSIIQLLQSVDAPFGTHVYIEQSSPFPKDGKQDVEMATKHLGVRLDKTESTAGAIQSEIANLRESLQASIDSTHAQNDRIDTMMKRFEEMMQSRSVLTKSIVFDASSSGGNFNDNFDRNFSDSGSGNPIGDIVLKSRNGKPKPKETTIALKAKTSRNEENLESVDGEEAAFYAKNMNRFKNLYHNKQNEIKTGGSKRFDMSCRNCGKPGHFARECRVPVQKKQKEVLIATWSDEDEDDDNQNNLALMARSSFDDSDDEEEKVSNPYEELLESFGELTDEYEKHEQGSQFYLISSQFESTGYDFLSEYKYPNRISERISSLSDKFNKSTSSVTDEQEIQRKNDQLINSGNFEESRSCSNATIQEQLLEIKQSKSVEEYRNRLISLAASLGGDSDKIKLSEFVNGFETVVRVEMRLRSPTCLEEATQFSVKIEERNRDLMRLRLGRDWAYQEAQSVAQIVVVESSSQGPRIFKIKPMLEKFTVSSVNRVEEIENEEAELVLALDSFKKSVPASTIRTEGGGGREIPYKEKSGRGSIKNRTILESFLIKTSGNRAAVDLNEGAFDLASFISDILSNTWKASDNESISVDSDNGDFNAKNKGNLVAMPFDRGRLFFTIESYKIERPIFKGAQESTGRKGRSGPWWVEMISGKSKVAMPFDRGRSGCVMGVGKILLVEVVQKLFESFLEAVVKQLVASESKRVQINHQSDQNPKDESKIYTAQFSQIGNEFIDGLREEELICRREMVLLSAIFCLRKKKNCTEEWEIFPGLAPMAASSFERDGDQLFKVYAGEYGVSGIIRSSDPGALPFDRGLKHQFSSKISLWGQGERLVAGIDKGAVMQRDCAGQLSSEGFNGWWSGGFGYGLWIGILVASGYSVVPVSSLLWKSEFKLTGLHSSKTSRQV
ncbi:hypothetical protein OROGR_016754 [Orobanche gracilis]